MFKKYKKILFLLFIPVFLSLANTCYAREVLSWPTLPFGNVTNITDNSTMPEYVVYFFTFGISIGGIIALLSLTVAGIQFVMSAENPERRNEAVARVKGSLIGLALLVSSFIIVGTINPQLQSIKVQPLNPLGGIQLTGANNKTTSAPLTAPTLETIRKDYAQIVWPKKVKNTAGEDIDNCDPDNENAVYVIYWYAEKNYKNFMDVTRLKCDGQQYTFGGAQSYEIIKEQPGVYFFDNGGCKPATGSNSTHLPVYSSTSIPEWNSSKRGAVVSVRIVNGPKKSNGPYFGLIYFDSPDYKTQNDSAWATFLHLGAVSRSANDNFSDCINVSKNNIGIPPNSDQTGSFIIYEASDKWGTGVTLYSKSAWTGGYYTINSQTAKDSNDLSKSTIGAEGAISIKELSNVKATYDPNMAIPLEEQKQCATFNPSFQCLQSFEIKGDFLVLISSVLDKPCRNNNCTEKISGLAQIFPKSPRLIENYANQPQGYSAERGTPELASDFITSGNAKYIEVIPLTKNLVTSQ